MSKTSSRAIIGLRLDENTIRDFKAEAARRGIPAARLFEELWSKYHRTGGKSR